ncbi:hypothetical protein G9A89_006141 [Geosiphon pyriformis]|nr:hypothetical protein G9A89_006141 [Geosiphon pyriformis]
MFCYNGLKKVWGQFKEFLDKRGGNVVDLGVGMSWKLVQRVVRWKSSELEPSSTFRIFKGIIIGTAFSSLVNSFVVCICSVNDILSPPLGLLFSGSNLANWFIIIRPGQTPGEKYHTPEEAQADGAV